MLEDPGRSYATSAKPSPSWSSATSQRRAWRRSPQTCALFCLSSSCTVSPPCIGMTGGSRGVWIPLRMQKGTREQSASDTRKCDKSCCSYVCRYNTETVSSDVLAQMKQRMVDANSASSHSFLLDDDSTLPFVAAEVDERFGLQAHRPWPRTATLASFGRAMLHVQVLSAMDDKELYAGMPLPEALKDPPGSSQQGGGAAGEGQTSVSTANVAAGFAFIEKNVVFQAQGSTAS